MTTSSTDLRAELAAAWGLPAQASGQPADEALLVVREQVNGFEALQQFDPAAPISQRELAGVRCLVAAPASASGTLLYFHGGGFGLGCLEPSAGLVSRIATSTGLEAVAAD